MMWLDENGNLFYLEQPQEYYTDEHMQEQPQEYYTDDHMQEQPLEYYTKDHLQEYFNNDQSNEESFQTSKVVSLLSGTEDLNSQQDVLLPSKSTIFVTPAPVEPTAEGLVLANDDGMLHKMIENDNIDDVVNEPEAELNDDTDVVATDTDLGKNSYLSCRIIDSFPQILKSKY